MVIGILFVFVLWRKRKSFLKHNLDQLKIDANDAMDLLSLSHHYGTVALKQHCATIVETCKPKQKNNFKNSN